LNGRASSFADVVWWPLCLVVFVLLVRGGKRSPRSRCVLCPA
jgi:hypothetical protein